MHISELFQHSFKTLRQQLGHKTDLPVVVPSTDSDLCREVVERGWLTPQQVAHAVARYRLGRSRSGKCIFWMIDDLGIVRDGHIGKQWASEMLRQRAPKLISHWYPEHCLFGMHLLCHTDITNNHSTSKNTKSTDKLRGGKGNTRSSFAGLLPSGRKNLTNSTDKLRGVEGYTYKPVCVVEKESSAVILSELFPDRIWLATVYPMNFNVFSFEPLRGHRVTLFPHTDETMNSYMCWLELADEAQRKYGLHVTVSDLLEQQATAEQKAAKIDLVDFLFAHR